MKMGTKLTDTWSYLPDWATPTALITIVAAIILFQFARSVASVLAGIAVAALAWNYLPHVIEIMPAGPLK